MPGCIGWDVVLHCHVDTALKGTKKPSAFSIIAQYKPLTMRCCLGKYKAYLIVEGKQTSQI